MKLTKRQLIQLKRSKEYRSNPPTVFAMYAKSKWKYLYMFLLYVGVSGYFWFHQEYVLSALFGGMLFGILYHRNISSLPKIWSIGRRDFSVVPLMQRKTSWAEFVCFKVTTAYTLGLIFFLWRVKFNVTLYMKQINVCSVFKCSLQSLLSGKSYFSPY